MSETIPISNDVLDKVTLLLCQLQDRAEVVKQCASLGIAADLIDSAIEQASGRLAEAAAVHRDVEKGRAIHRLNELYVLAKNEPDVKSAIAAQKELNRLMGLYPDRWPAKVPEAEEPETEHNEDETADVFAAIEKHLEPLGLSNNPHDNYADIVRLAGAEIRRLQKTFKGKTPKSKA